MAGSLAPADAGSLVQGSVNAASLGSKAASDQPRIAICACCNKEVFLQYLALGLALRQKNLSVRFFTPKNFRGLCESYGLDAVPVFLDTDELFREVSLRFGWRPPTQQRAMDRWSSDLLIFCNGVISKTGDHDWHPGQEVQDALRAFKPHALISGIGTRGVCSQYEASEAVPALPVYSGPSCLHVLGVGRAESLCPFRPSFYPMCHLLDDKPTPLPITRTNAWTLDDPLVDSEDLRELNTFLGKEERKHPLRGVQPGDRLVAIDWGGMFSDMSPERAVVLALRVLRSAGYPGVILGGITGIDKLGKQLANGRTGWLQDIVGPKEAAALVTFATFQVCFVEDIPLDELLPQCCCFVNQGSSKQMHAALRASCPSVITPGTPDGFLIGRRVTALNDPAVGLAFDRSLSKIIAGEIAHAMDTVVKAAAATELKSPVAPEADVHTAAAKIDRFLRFDVLPGSWLKQFRRQSERRPSGAADLHEKRPGQLRHQGRREELAKEKLCSPVA